MDQSINNITYSPIKTKKEAFAFLRSVYFDQKINFHPDDDFADIISIDGYHDMFSSAEAEALNNQIKDCFEVLGEQIYDVCFENLKELRNTNVYPSI